MELTKEDDLLTQKIINCGTNKTKYKKDILYLFRKYVDGTALICMNCSTELAMVWVKYKQKYLTYKSKQDGTT